MSPPKLTGNTPVVNIFHPVGVSLCESFGNKLNFAVVYYAESFLGERLHLNEPLVACKRLNSSTATVTSTNIVSIILNLDECAAFFKVFYNLLTRFVAVKSLIFSTLCIDCSVGVHYIDDGKVVTKTNFKVVGVVCRSNLNGTCTEVLFNIFVSNDYDFTTNKGKDTSLSNEVCVSFILGMNCDSCIAKKCFGTSCSNFNVAVRIAHLITDMPEMTALF